MNLVTATVARRVGETPSWLIGRLAARSKRLLNDGFARVDSRGYHHLLLAALDEFGPTSQADLGRRSGIDRSDVVASINELVERGMVQRAVDPADRRRNRIMLTSAGARHLRRLDQVVSSVQDALLAPLSPAQRRQFVQLLERLVNADGE